MNILNLMNAEGGGGGSIWMIVIVVVLLVVMMGASIIPQRKRKKQAQEMMANLGVGAKVKTIGGFVGIILAIDDATNTLEINIGSETAPVLVTLDKAAIYTVISGVAVKSEANTNANAETQEIFEVASVEDAEANEKAEAKKAEKAAKKAKKEAEKAIIESEIANSENVVENVEAIDVVDTDADKKN